MSEILCAACSHLRAPGKLGVAVWDAERQGHYCDKCGAFIDVDAILADDESERAQDLAQIQEAQSTLARLQMQYRDNTREWFALAAAVELVRVAWYEVHGDADTAREKFTDNTARAMAEYERFAARDDARRAGVKMHSQGA